MFTPPSPAIAGAADTQAPWLIVAHGPRQRLRQGVQPWVLRALSIGLLLVLLAVMGSLTGCAGLPSVNRAAIASEAIPLSKSSNLGRIASAYRPAEDQSGFRLMPLGTFSLDTRVQLAQRAQVSLDVQYYHFENDVTGRWLLRALRDAANRGVRVRLLIDDLYTGGHDELWLAFAAHPNVQVRVFNPFSRARDEGQALRFLADLGEIKRLNHRMHNKLFLADGAMAVIGGRNVADEYFLRSQGENFIDVDAFVVGWIIEPLQGLFDRYWNADAVYPLGSVTRTGVAPETLRERFEVWTGPETTPPVPPATGTDILGYGPVAEDLEEGRLGLVWGEAYVFADQPDKPFEGEAGGELQETSVTFNVYEALRKARTEVIVSSPYLVPGKDGMQLVNELRARDVRVVMMTNSLGSTDEPVVHVGYSKYREPLLDAGVDLYEISASRVKRNRRLNLFGSSLGRLHAKLAVVDREVLFIGSMNLDPRSATINTELGAVVRSPQLAKEMVRIIDIDRLQSAYRVRRAPSGAGLQWLGFDDEDEMVLNDEPDSSFWLRFKAWLLRPFVPESLL